MTEVTDPELLKALNAKSGSAVGASSSDAGGEVVDPALLEILNNAATATPPTIPEGPAGAAERAAKTGSYFTPQERSEFAALGAHGMGSGFWEGLTGGVGDMASAAVAAPLMYAHDKYYGYPGSLADKYWMGLEMNRLTQKGYENANPITAGASEVIGMYANPVSGVAEKTAVRMGVGAQAAVRSRVSPNWGRQAAGAVARMSAEAIPGSAAMGAEAALGHGENLAPWQYVTTPLSGALHGAAGSLLVAPPIYGAVRGTKYAGDMLAPVANALGKMGSAILPSALSKPLMQSVENSTKNAAMANISHAIDQAGDTINAKRASRGEEPIDPIDEIRKQVLPLRGPGISTKINDDQLEVMLRRAKAVAESPQRSASFSGQPDSNRRIGADYGVSDKTVADYYQRFKAKQDVPTNIVDQADRLAAQQDSRGAEVPIQELTRIAAGHGGANKSELLAGLAQRQYEQGARMTRHIDEAAGVGQGKAAPQTLDQAVDAAANLTGKVSDEAYSPVRNDRTPIDLDGALTGHIFRYTGMPEDSSIKGIYGRFIKMFRGVNQNKAGISDPLQAVFNPQALGTDTNRFLMARAELDDAIRSSSGYQRKVLNELRSDVNDSARRQNNGLASADANFSEGKSMENIIERGASLAPKLNWKSNDDIKFFDSLIPEQKELFRKAFAQKLKDIVNESKENSAYVAGRFTTKAARDMIEKILGEIPGKLLNERITQEATTTKTLNRAFGGSQTAPWGEAMKQFRLGAEMPADIALGAWGAAKRAGVDLLKYQMSADKAAQVGKILSDTDPFHKLDALSKLRQARMQRARDAQNRSALGHAGVRTYAPLTGPWAGNAAGSLLGEER